VSGGHPCVERLMLPEALSGRLSPAEEKRVMAHVETCAICQEAAADIEVSLISLAVLRDEQEHPFAAGPAVAAPAGATAPVVPLPSARSRWPVRLMAAAAAIVLLAGGAVVGRQLLPPRDGEHYGAPIALIPPATAKDQAARGTVAVASLGSALAVKLNASSLPQAGWYECVWVAEGQTRSAGSFRASGGTAKDVELRVAQPQDSHTWELQVIAHSGAASEVVLEGSVT
jgi:Putative zinc-finger